MIFPVGVILITLLEEVNSDAVSQEPSIIDSRPYLIFHPPVDEKPLMVDTAKAVRSRNRIVGSISLASAATVALVHGIYFTLVDHPIEYPIVNQVTIGIAIYAFLTAFMTFRGRRYLFAVSGPLVLLFVVVWDIRMEYLCFHLHNPIAAYALTPLIVLSLASIIRSRDEFPN